MDNDTGTNQIVPEQSTTTILIGLGKGGSALLPYLLANSQFKLVGVCDSMSDAVGMPMARMCRIPVFNDALAAVHELKPQLVIDASGDPSLPSVLHQARPAGTSVVTAEASRLLWDLLSALEGRRRSDLRYDRLMRDMQSGLVVVQNEKVRFVNPAFVKMFGYTVEQILGHPYMNLVAPEFRERDLNLHRQRVAGKTVAEEYETAILHGDGGLREVMVRARLSEWDGHPACLLIISDVTNVRELQRERERFFRFIVHELRAALSPLVTAVGMLKLPKIVQNSEKLDSLKDLMQRSTDRLRSIVDDFLDLSKFEQALVLKQQPLDLSSIINDVAETQAVLAEDKGINLDVTPWDFFAVRGDEFVVRTLAQNLINNAIKYTAEGGVTVAVEHDSEQFTVKVKDTGPGLTPEEAEKLFAEFGRSRRTAGVKGSGLGLALVKTLAERGGGKTWVESNGSDQGCTFAFSLPLVFGDEH